MLGLRRALALALSAPVVFLPAVLTAVPAHAVVPVQPLSTGCGIELLDVRADALLARVRVMVLPGLQGVPLAQDGLLATRGTVQVPFSLPVGGEAVRVVLNLDGVDGPIWDVSVPNCAGASTAPLPGPLPSPAGPVLPAPSPAPGPTQPGPTQPGPTQPGPTQPGPTQPGPTQPGPTQPGPIQPSAPGPTAPSPAGRAPTAPVPVPATIPGALPAPTAPTDGTVNTLLGSAAPGAPVVGPLTPLTSAMASGGASVAALSAFAPMPMLASALVSASASVGVPAPVVAPDPGQAAVPLAVDGADDTGLGSFTAPTSPPPTAPIIRAASGTPMTAVRGYVDLAPAAVLVAGSLGGLFVVTRRRRTT